MENMDRMVAEFCDLLLSADHNQRTQYALGAASILLDFAAVDRQRSEDAQTAEILSEMSRSLRSVGASERNAPNYEEPFCWVH